MKDLSVLEREKKCTAKVIVEVSLCIMESEELFLEIFKQNDDWQGLFLER